MNNNYYNFNPNPNFNRNIPIMPVNPNIPNNIGVFRNANQIPRLSSLFSGSRAGALTGAATTSKVTFSSLLNGASKTLGVINQAIPVFYQVKPIWNNAKTMFRVMNEFKNIDNKTNENVSLQSNSIIESSTSQNNTNSTINKKTSYQSNQGPTFFQ